MASRITIGLPVYNGENYLRESLDSVLSQTYQDFELLISDNCSTDRTAEICRACAARDSRIRYHRNSEHVGAAENFNRVFRMAATEYFKWHAHDDVMASDFLERCVEALDRHPEVVLAHPLTRVINGSGALVANRYVDTRWFYARQPHQRFGSRTSRRRIPLPLLGERDPDVMPIWGVIRSQALARTALLGPYSGGDDVLLAQLAILGPFFRVEEYLYCQRQHPGQSSRAFYGRRLHAVWFDPRNEGRILLPDCRMFAEFIRSVGRFPLSPVQRALCYARMVPYFFWNWPRMARDVLVALGSWVPSAGRDPRRAHVERHA